MSSELKIVLDAIGYALAWFVINVLGVAYVWWLVKR